MIIETKFGTYEMIKNYRDAFDLVKFEERYIEELYDKYTYIVGDVSSEILRLKGFSNDPKSKKSFKTIPDYLNEACGVNYPYYILKRIKIQPVEPIEPELKKAVSTPVEDTNKK